MQIVCNNCGNPLHFPDNQSQVTCRNCHTHLKIEETESTITATIIEQLDDTIFQRTATEITVNQALSPLYHLLRLEMDYEETMNENFFWSVLGGKKVKPILFRAIFRVLFGVWFLSDLFAGKATTFSIFVILYCLFLIQAGIREFLRWRRLRAFEKYYLFEKRVLVTQINQLNLPFALKNWHKQLLSNHDVYLGIRNLYFEFKLFGLFKINIGSPSFSQALRMFFITFWMGVLTGVIFQRQGLFAIVILIITLAFGNATLFIFQNFSNFFTSHDEMLKSRKDIIDELKRYLHS